MASIVGPVPNQPVYVWQPSLSTIGMRGNIIGTATRLPIYGNTITGTQTVMLIPVLYTGIDHRGRIYIHGFHLPAQSIIGATRFRIPMIVRIWNYVATGINVIATFIEKHAEVNLIATASHNSGAMYHTYMHLGGIQSIGWLKLCFTITGIKRVALVMYNSFANLIYHPKLYLSDFRGRIANKVKLQVSVLRDRIIAKLKVSTSILEITHHSLLMVSDLRDTITNKLKLSASVANNDHTRVAKLFTNVDNSDIKKTFKMLVRPWGVALTGNIKLCVRTLNTELEHTVKMSVDLVGKVLVGIMSYIKFLLEGYGVEQKITVRSTADQNSQNMRNMIHVEVLEYKKQVHVLAHALRKRLAHRLNTIIQLTKTLVDRLLSFQVTKSKKGSDVHIWNTPERIKRSLSVQTKAESFNAKVSLFVHTERFRDEQVLLEINPISWLGEANIKFTPANMPRAALLNVLITVCETWVLAYLNFVPDELLGAINVRMSTCSHEMSSIIQWYLHGGRISNHGKGNEVIFDLGEVDPIGPIPPVPSRQWQGGWVEDPFKGVGYIPASDSTGYGSPSVQDWLSNVEMYWGKASDPFTGGDDTGA